MVLVEALKRCSVEAVDHCKPLTIQRDINLRSSGNQCFPEFNQHDFHLNGLVLHPAWCVAPAHGVHDHRCGFLGLFSDGLHHLSRERRRKIFRIHGMDCRYLFSGTGFACPLAFVTLPLVIITLVQVFRRRWDRHKRIARWTIPIWLYVSVTGVLVYLMLYKWFPPGT
jgi:Protein of unknown function (DUF420)